MKLLTAKTTIIFLYFISFFLIVGTVSAQSSIWSNEITGTNPNTSNPYTTGQVVATGITVSGIGRGAGIDGAGGINRYNASSWNTTSFDPTAYFEFTITPDAGKVVDLSSIDVAAQRTSTGPTSLSARSSIDNFAADITPPGTVNVSILPEGFEASLSLNVSNFANIASPITFRVYGWGASAQDGTASINRFQFNGTVHSALPVLFGKIDAVRKNGKIRVNWITENETNNKYFEIQASSDGSNFKTVQTIASKNGNSDTPQEYEVLIDVSTIAPMLAISLLFFMPLAFKKRRRSLLIGIVSLCSIFYFISCKKNSDDIAQNQKVFIRIKQVNIDGSFEYSKIMQVINYQ